jgi:hypothetical protein
LRSLDKTEPNTGNIPIIGQDGAKRRQYLNKWTRRGQTQRTAGVRNTENIGITGQDGAKHRKYKSFKLTAITLTSDIVHLRRSEEGKSRLLVRTLRVAESNGRQNYYLFYIKKSSDCVQQIFKLLSQIKEIKKNDSNF